MGSRSKVSYQKYLWIFFSLALLNAVVGSFLEEVTGEEGEHEKIGNYERISVLAIASILIFLSILFELGKHKIESTTSEDLEPVITHLFQELTVLGFLSLLTFLVVQLGAFYENPLSVAIFGEDEEELLSELIEWIHMGLFLMLIVFIIEVVLLIRLGENEKYKWDKAELYATRHTERLLFNYNKSIKKGGGNSNSFIWKLFPFCNPSGTAENMMNYYAMRQEFIAPRDSSRSALPRDFAFNKYLSICMGEVLGEIVEISLRSWLFLELVFVLFFFLSYASYWWIVGFYFAFGWILAIGAVYLSISLSHLQRHLVPRINLSQLINEDSPLLTSDKFTVPKFTQRPLQRRTAVGHFFLGQPANKHQLLFLADSKGPELLVFAIRMLVLLSAIYCSLVLVIIYKAPDPVWVYTLIYIPCALLPLLFAGLFYLPKILRLWVIVCNVEMLKNHEAITKVVRLQKTEKSLRLLKVIQVMRFKTLRKQGKMDEEQGGRAMDVSSLSPEKLQSLKEVFAIFDEDNSGNIDVNELVSVFGTLGQEISQFEAEELILELDQDGDGELSFEEFAVYFKQCTDTADLEDQNPDQMVEEMFSIFDKDGDGDITVDEFSSILCKLGASLTQDDINAIVDEMDEDGDGQISLEEFRHMVKKHTEADIKQKKKRCRR